MKNIFAFTLLITTILSCQNRLETQFSEEALKDELINLKDESVSLESILEQHKGNTIFIDVWASWCKDCLKGLPGVKMLQADSPRNRFYLLIP